MIKQSTMVNTKLTEDFFEAVCPDGRFHFIIDYSVMCSDLAATLSIDRTRKEHCSGSLAEHADKLIFANECGANVYFIPNDHAGNSLAFVHTTNYKTLKEGIPPNFLIKRTESMYFTAYWIINKASESEMRELNERAIYKYDGEHYGANPNEPQFVPGFTRHLAEDRRIESNVKCEISDWVRDRKHSTQVHDYFVMKNLLPPKPRKSYEEILSEMLEELSHECSPLNPGDKYADDHLAHIAAICIRRSYALEDIVRLCRYVNDYAHLRLPEDKIRLMCAYLIEDVSDNSDPRPMADQLFSIASANVGYFLDSPPLPRKDLIQNCLPEGKVGLLVARGGTGKSQFAIQLAISVATGVSLIGTWAVTNPGKVLYLGAEDDEDELHRRVFQSANEMAKETGDSVNFYKCLRANLSVKSLTAVDVKMTGYEFSREITVTENFEKLVNTVKAIHNLKLIIIDPVSRFRGGQENSAEDTTRFVEVMEKLAKVTSACVIAIHHVNKWSGNSAEQLQEASRGSSALTDGVRWQANLAAMTPAEAKEYQIKDEDRSYYVTLAVTKNNYAPPQPKHILKRGEGGVLHHVSLESAKSQRSENLQTRLVDIVKSEAKRGALYSKSSFEDRFGGIDGPFGIGKVALRNLINDMIASGKLIIHARKLALPGHTIPNAKVMEV